MGIMGRIPFEDFAACFSECDYRRAGFTFSFRITMCILVTCSMWGTVSY